MTRVFAYLRVSDSSQIKGDGFTRQEKACQDYASAHDMKIVQIFQEAYTGTELNRPELAKLMVSLEQNHHGVKTVLIERLDRLARDYFIQEAIIRDFQGKGFTLISSNVEEPDLCSNDPTRKLIRTFLGGIVEYEKSMLVLKLRASRERIKARTGKCEGRKGYKESPEGQSIIRHIKALHRKPQYGRRKTIKQIAEILNTEGVLTINKRAWTISSVRDILFER